MSKHDGTIWRTRDGRNLSIFEMHEAHLDNTIKFLRRNGWVTPAESLPRPRFPVMQGEYAQMFAEQEFDAEMERYLKQRVSRRLALMESELATRKKAREQPCSP